MAEENGNAEQNKDQWCFAWLPQSQVTGKTKAALVKDSKWGSGDRITISFLDGDHGVQQRIKQVAKTWIAPNMANLRLDFRDDTNNTFVRISFKHPGSWSTVGTTCRAITDLSEPTMNFGWLTPNSTQESLERVVLHEFGHALGLIHEHQNAAGGIQWNKENVIRDLSGPPNNWSLDDIEHNMFEPHAKAETNFTDLDASSIMMYPIPSSWTTNGFSVGLNTALSTKDKQFIRQQYP
jgi:serralysin